VSSQSRVHNNKDMPRDADQDESFSTLASAGSASVAPEQPAAERWPQSKARGTTKAQSSFTLLRSAVEPGCCEDTPHTEDARLSDIVAQLYRECGVAREDISDAFESPRGCARRPQSTPDDNEDPPAFSRERSRSLPMLEIERCMLCGCDKFTPGRFETPCVLCGAHSNRVDAEAPPRATSEEVRPTSKLPPRLAQIAAACRRRRLGLAPDDGAFEQATPQAPPSPGKWSRAPGTSDSCSSSSHARHAVCPV
jgi:hypothetical protein